jgi:tRNA(Ile)-lysidine synthase
VDSLAERVLFHIRRQELLHAGERVGVAVSGGIDSVALLRVLLELRGELGIVLSVVHFNHRLRGAESDGDEEFVAGLAREYDLEFFVDGDDVAGHAAAEHVSVETAARELRYGFFRYLLGEDGAGPQGLKPDSPSLSVRGPEGPLFHSAVLGAAGSRALSKPASARLNKIVTGHTLDDQAETVLMRMIRGSGVRGVGGIHPRIVVEDDDGEISGEIVRPLLNVRHRELERYLEDIGQPWREDSTNADERFTRNRVRKLVVPLLEREFNPAVAENLAELAEIARGEEDYWENEVSGWLGTVVQWSEPEWAQAVSGRDGLVQIAGHGNLLGGADKTPTSRAKGAREMGHPARLGADNLRLRIENAAWLVMNASVSRMWFLAEPVAVQRRLVKAIGENAGIPLEFKHVEEILRVVGDEDASGKEVSLPLGWKLVVEPEELRFVTPDLREPVPPQDYDYELPVPGQVVVYEAGCAIEARTIPAGEAAAYNPEQLLDAENLPGLLRVRNWRPGDRYWPAHTKSPKKIKELLQERHVAQPERRAWPVVVSGDEIVWMRGFPLPAKVRGKAGRAAILIVETPLRAGE